MKYITGIKHQLREDLVIQTTITGFSVSTSEYILHPDGHLVIKEGWVWNGSNLVPDRKKSLRASCVHDCMYVMIARGHLPSSCQVVADLLYHAICKENGLWEWVTKLRFKGLKSATALGNTPEDRPILEAP